MNDPKKELIEAINGAQNVLVTVSKNPSIDQLAAAIGTTLVLNKLGKHGTAVFSGTTPSTIDFLKPEATLEHTTDSLRDFIISLDKSKADKLRYKVEDQHVKIFITPYRSTIGQSDLEFSQGDFNVDVVLALGVHEQGELDQAITAHGRILHDAKIISVNLDHAGELGGINIIEKSSSLSEIMSHVSVQLKDGLFDSQIATAFLTGIVAETERFSNEKTLPETMTVSAKLMAAGANQQLVATQLQVTPEPVVAEASPPEVSNEAPPTTESSVKHDDGSLSIVHSQDTASEKADEPSNPHEIGVDEHGNITSLAKDQANEKLPATDPSNDHPKIISRPAQRIEPPEVVKQALNDDAAGVDELPALPPQPELPEVHGRGRMILDPPTTQGTLTANDKPEAEEGSSDPLSSQVVTGPTLSHEHPGEVGASPEQSEPEAAQPAEEPKNTDEVNSSEQQANDVSATPDLDKLKNSVDAALENAKNEPALDPIVALNANPVDLNLGHDDAGEQEGSNPDQNTSPSNEEFLDISKVDTNTGLTDNNEVGAETASNSPASGLVLPPVVDESKPPETNAPSSPSPPPVPPPMMPPLPGGSTDDLSLPPVRQ